MPTIVPFRLRLTGDTADQHEFQGYDGYMALAGFARTLSLITNYADTGKIRQRGDFEGRHSVKAKAIDEGSVVADFVVYLQHNPIEIFGIATGTLTASALLYSLVTRVVNRNLGQSNEENDAIISRILREKSGDIEALVAISEAPIRQAHSVIGNGAKNIEISGGYNIINNFNEETKEYVRLNVEDNTVMEKLVSVSGFSANSGYGGIFDSDLGRVVPIAMPKDVLKKYKSVFSWGLDQYVNGTGKKIVIRFTRILAMDGRAKKYMITSASLPDESASSDDISDLI